MSLVQAYQDQVSSLLEQLKSAEGSTLDATKLREARKLLKLLRMEAAGISCAQEKSVLVAWVRERNETVDKLQLFGVQGVAGRVHPTEERSLATLRQAKQTMLETEDVAHGITEQLASNREVLAKNIDRNKDVQADLSTSDKLLNNLSKWWR